MKNLILTCLFLFLLAPFAQAQGVNIVSADSISQMKEPSPNEGYYVEVAPKCLNFTEIMTLIAPLVVASVKRSDTCTQREYRRVFAHPTQTIVKPNLLIIVKR